MAVSQISGRLTGPDVAFGLVLLMILPFVEETALHDLIDYSVAALAPSNRRAGATMIPIYRCPAHDGPDYSQEKS